MANMESMRGGPLKWDWKRVSDTISSMGINDLLFKYEAKEPVLGFWFLMMNAYHTYNNTRYYYIPVTIKYKTDTDEYSINHFITQYSSTDGDGTTKYTPSPLNRIVSDEMCGGYTKHGSYNPGFLDLNTNPVYTPSSTIPYRTFYYKNPQITKDHNYCCLYIPIEKYFKGSLEFYTNRQSMTYVTYTFDIYTALIDD